MARGEDARLFLGMSNLLGRYVGVGKGFATGFSASRPRQE